MIVRTLEHGEKVFASLRQAKWLALDTETQNKPKFKGKKDTLVYGRMDVRVWSLCYKGVSYCFPTNKFDPKFPLMVEWFDLLKSVLNKGTIIAVFGNAGYDILVFSGVDDEFIWKAIWDVIIGGWMANPVLEKSLKARAPLYGRHLGSLRIAQKAKKEGYVAISSSSLKEYAEYAEEDVVLTDEMYQMQQFGIVRRPKILRFVKEDGSILKVRNQMPQREFSLPKESLREFDRDFILLQELPVLRSVIDATQRGFPVLREELAAIHSKLVEDYKRLTKQIFRFAGKKINLNSHQQVGELLRKLKVKNRFKTKLGQDKTDSKSLFKLQAENQDKPILGALIEYSKVNKLISFVKDQKDKGLPYFIADDDRIHCTQNSIGAVTGRFSSQNPNLHQIPSQADTYGIKYAFVAPGVKSVLNPKLIRKTKKGRILWPAKRR